MPFSLLGVNGPPSSRSARRASGPDGGRWADTADDNATHDALDVTSESLDSLEATLSAADQVMGSTTASLS